MKRILLLTLWNLAVSTPMFYVVCCGPSAEQREQERLITGKAFEVNGSYYQIIEIDSCEYLYNNVITHKGNCKNPIHYK